MTNTRPFIAFSRPTEVALTCIVEIPMATKPATVAPDAAPSEPSASLSPNVSGPTDRLSTQAIVTYILLFQFNMVGVGIFALIATGAKIDPVMLGVLGGLIAAVTNAVSLAIGYWLGSSSGSKAASAALVNIATAQSA